ncbi:ATP-grasp domain-containing protein [Pyrobaculum neutrophilum]|uniref:Alpha-L-glutamate ligase, RimK family n=1 Tax=Pyrobaculum neutrophilum (strain DSM 2338 / JCM 9278 / NBRC 100436 / V24Sta) TaxID=444157 RepID=B1YD39_PYRNV|nr:RimK family alpha-L-glutamate ligase [Pyrobaculum neutrophilum]ACB39702.1 alpha-L-glutamate ligase, RimK family [Pyrobaculum neutrophilum V24Sta]
MEIGIIRPYEVEFNPGDVADLEEAVRKRGHTPVRIYVDMLEVRIESAGLRIRQSVGKSPPVEVAPPGAVLRHLGIFRDFEQFLYRVWAAKALEEAGTYVMNPVERWVVAGDKMAALMKLAKAGLPVPPTVVTENMFVGYRAVGEFKRAVVKQMRGAMGYGAFLVEDPDVAFHIFSMLANINKPIYVQRFLEKGPGDYRVVVVGGRAVGAEYRRADGWKTNVAQGAAPEPAKLTPQLEELAVKAVETLGLDYGGVDIAETREGYYILEVNPTMSWQGFKVATGVNPAEHIVDHLIGKIKR